MKSRSIVLLFILLICLGLGAGSALAGTIGPSCGSCEGGVYTLTYTNFQTIGPNDQLDVSLNFNTTTYTGGGIYIDAAAVKIAPALISTVLIGAPASLPNSSVWNTFDGALNANGCSGAGSGFVCTESTGDGAATSNLTNTFTWRITILSGTLLSGQDAASIKGLFTDAQGNKTGAVLSENISLDPGGNDISTPEPISFVLMGAGLAGIAALRHRTH